jgi:[ribosomal protein S18]-alanine N-acetyltransferase
VNGENIIVDQAISIAPACGDDLDQLWALEVKVFEELAYPYFVLRQLFDTLRGCWLVAHHPSGLVGYSLAAPTPDRQLAWMLGLAVAPDFRNLGYGRQLTVESLRLLASMGIPDVCLTVDPDNDFALRLYRHVGFSVVDRRRDYLGPGEDRLLMARSLGSGAIPMPRPISSVE